MFCDRFIFLDARLRRIARPLECLPKLVGRPAEATWKASCMMPGNSAVSSQPVMFCAGAGYTDVSASGIRPIMKVGT